ncbi:MAG: glycosyltransferase family 2 protein [Candidatus Omnitrophica bacterium]|nr:glycosyltransferase family 2 protein [Candidatus Omnitrophota bacterium]
MNIWVIIPAYNESRSLEIVLKGLKDRNLSILVVDDGSKDNTYKLAKKWADVVIKSKRNFGKGVSIKKGISYLKENKLFDCIITMDADGQHSLLDLDKFIKEAEAGVSVLVGNRMDNHSGMPLTRVVANNLMSWIISAITRQKIPDTQCGFRLIKKEVLEKITIKTKKFEIESEILIKAGRAGFTIKSIPIESIYYKNIRSRINPFIDTIRFFNFIFKNHR